MNCFRQLLHKSLVTLQGAREPAWGQPPQAISCTNKIIASPKCNCTHTAWYKAEGQSPCRSANFNIEDPLNSYKA